MGGREREEGGRQVGGEHGVRREGCWIEEGTEGSRREGGRKGE